MKELVADLLVAMTVALFGLLVATNAPLVLGPWLLPR